MPVGPLEPHLPTRSEPTSPSPNSSLSDVSERPFSHLSDTSPHHSSRAVSQPSEVDPITNSRLSVMQGRHISQRYSAGCHDLLVPPGKGVSKKDRIPHWQRDVGVNLPGTPRKWLYIKFVWGYQSGMGPSTVKQRGNP